MLIAYEFSVKPGTAREAAQVIEGELENSRKAPGCLDLRIFFDAGADKLFLYERWESQEHVDDYLAYRAREKRPNPVEPYLVAPRVRAQYEEL